MEYNLTITKFLQQVLSKTNLHGVFHLTHRRSSYIEKIIWLAIVTMSMTAGFYTVGIFWIRYWTNPTVVALDRDYHLWNTTFPSLTVCFQKRLNDQALEEHLAQVDPTVAPRYADFLIALVESDIQSIGELTEFEEFDDANLLQLVDELTDRSKAILTIGEDLQANLVRTITEMGICYTFNSAILQYIAIDRSEASTGALFEVSIFDQETSATITNATSNANIFFHSPYEMPNIQRSLMLERGMFSFTHMFFNAIAIHAEPATRALSIRQRKCRFPYESHLQLFPEYYTYELCLLECKLRFFLEQCKCIPHFYKIKASEKYKYCTISQLACIEMYHRYVTFLTAKELREGGSACECLRNCEDITYTLQKYESTVWFNDPVIKWEANIPKIRYSRRVIYGFIDALVSTGSILAFFFGFSIITVIEFAYFFLRKFITICYNRVDRFRKVNAKRTQTKIVRFRTVSKQK